MAYGARFHALEALAAELAIGKRSSARRYAVRPLTKWSRRTAAQSIAYGIRRPHRTDVLDLNQERARLAKAQADKTALEIKRLDRERLLTEEIVMLWRQLAASCRAKLLVLPSKLAPQMASTNNVSIAQEQLRDAIYEAPKELSRFELEEGPRNGGHLGPALPA